jgi:predicted dehydrogenase
LGYGFHPSPTSLLANRRKTTTLIDPDGKVLEETHPRTADDTIFLHGTLSTGIPLSLSMRGGPAFKNTPGMDWRIYGETGEIRVTASGPFVQIGYPDMKAEVFDFKSNEVREVVLAKDEFEELGVPGRNVARVYRAFAEGEIVCSFADAVERHRLIDQMYRENGIEV